MDPIEDRTYTKIIAHSHNKNLTCLAWKPGEDVLASGANDNIVKIWRRPERDGTQYLTEELKQEEEVRCLDWNGDTDMMAIGTDMATEEASASVLGLLSLKV